MQSVVSNYKLIYSWYMQNYAFSKYIIETVAMSVYTNVEYIIWATSWENLFVPCANNKNADQPAHLRSLISAFIVRCLDSMIYLLAITEISSL